MSAPLLTMEGVHTHIGHYHILQGVDLTLPRGELTVLLGRNGAGKTTTLRTIINLWQASKGRIVFDGQDITNWRTPRIVRQGIGYVPENMGIFSLLTVQENMRLAAERRHFDTARLDWIFGLFPALKKFWTTPAGLLSGGQKQMLSIARAIIEPRAFLIIDEPSKGLAPAIIKDLVQAIRELKQTDTTILLVEQNFSFARAVGDHVAVMDDGRVVHAGSMSDLADDTELQGRLLGLSLDAHA
ncbi:High-affinity branched-chain amino acid transport ATP-binding protein [Salinisphaera dokdonensis CL-ES53]|uniref:High-affinity branched-chain amino acid transport ATP-binding protein n=1 Tax=Salinisphaera dokdonensis CL-ES53 TaxID=1304272 RepID=A0ABV2B3W3_9GAMM